MKIIIKKAKEVILLLTVITIACGCNKILKDYKLDTSPDFLSSIDLLEYIASGRDTTLTLYGEAVKFANLEDSIADGTKTRIVPTNNAIRTVLLSAGVSTIQELQPNVIRGLFSYLTFPGTYRSVDLGVDQTIETKTLSGEPLYLTRLISGSDRYHLCVNNSDMLATPPSDVIRQDYVFRDGISHVVDYFPTYQRTKKPTDPVPVGVDYSSAKKDTLWVTDDSHAYTGGKNNNYNTAVNQMVSRSGQLRYTFFKFDVPAIDYADDLTSAKLNFFVNAINGSNFIPFCGVYETTTDTWRGATLTWNTMPEFGQEIATTELALNWNEVNLTSHIQNSYKNNKGVISLGLQLLNGANVTSSSVQIRNSEASGGTYKQFISLMGAIPSEIRLNEILPLSVKNNSFAVLTKSNVSMSGISTKYNYSDNNIIYALMETPVHGALAKYGLPMIKYSQFTQEELSNGAIKYIHNGGTNDDVFWLKAMDYIGGVYPDLLKVPVTIR